MTNSTTKTPLRHGTVVWYNFHMKMYTCLIIATVGIKVCAEDYKEATAKGLKTVEDIQHATTGALKYLGIRWELDSVLQERDD